MSAVIVCGIFSCNVPHSTRKLIIAQQEKISEVSPRIYRLDYGLQDTITIVVSTLAGRGCRRYPLKVRLLPKTSDIEAGHGMDIPLGGGRWIGGFGVLRNILVLYNQRELGITYIAQSRLLARNSVPWRKMAQSGVGDFLNILFSLLEPGYWYYCMYKSFCPGAIVLCGSLKITYNTIDVLCTICGSLINIFDRELLVGVSRKTASKHWKAVNSVLSPQCPLLSRRIFVHNVLHFLSYNNNNLDYNICA